MRLPRNNASANNVGVSMISLPMISNMSRGQAVENPREDQ